MLNISYTSNYFMQIYQTFDRFLQPKMRVERGATRINNFTTNRNCTKLYRDRNQVEADDMAWGLQNFINWLDENFADPVILMAHNCHKFDGKVILITKIIFIVFFKTIQLLKYTFTVSLDSNVNLALVFLV